MRTGMRTEDDILSLGELPRFNVGVTGMGDGGGCGVKDGGCDRRGSAR